MFQLPSHYPYRNCFDHFGVLLISQEARDQCVCSTGYPIMGHLVKQVLKKSSPQGLPVSLPASSLILVIRPRSWVSHEQPH